MYLEHFGLKEAPYRITPHTDFFFAGANRGATLEALMYAITNDEGIVKVTGEVGSGKTMLCRVLMERLPANVETIYLSNPSLARDEIMLAILDDLKAPSPAERSSLILRALQDRLVALYAEGRRVVVLIDEAHAMPVETLEEIRLLSNLESKRHKLLQIVLFGQQELDEVLGTSQMRQLKERIVHSFRLEPLVRSDIGTYLMFRMRQAGYKGPDLFSEGAIRLITEVSEGLTRRINILADKALLAAFADNGYQVLPKHAQAAIADSDFARLNRGNRPALSTIGLALAAVGLITAGAAAALLAVYIAWTRANGAAPSRSSLSSPAAPPAPAAVAPAAGPAALSPPASVVPSVPAKAATPPTPAAPPARPAATAEAPTAAAAPTATGEAPGLAARERATAAWLREAPATTLTLQLLTADTARAGEVDAWLARPPDGIDTGKLYVYNATVRGANRYWVLYGAYPDRTAAQKALSGLPQKLRETKPMIRSVAAIRSDLQAQ